MLDWTKNFTIAPQIGAQRKKQVLFPLKPPKAHITLFGYSMKTSSFWSSLYNTNKIIRDIFENKGLPRFSHIYGSLLSCDVFWDEEVKTPLFSLKTGKCSFNISITLVSMHCILCWGVHRSHSWQSIGVWARTGPRFWVSLNNCQLVSGPVRRVGGGQ